MLPTGDEVHNKTYIEESRIEEMSTAQHDNIFSLMKGLAIISVVVGHCSMASVEGFVNQYHLATFYFVAGYLFNPAYLDAPKAFIMKRIQRLYLPFVSYGLMFLLLHNVFCHLELYPIDGIYTMSDFVHNGLKLMLFLLLTNRLMGGNVVRAVAANGVNSLFISKKSVANHKMGGGNFMLPDWIYMYKNESEKPVLLMECDDYSSNFSSWQRVERAPMATTLCW